MPEEPATPRPPITPAMTRPGSPAPLRPAPVGAAPRTRFARAGFGLIEGLIVVGLVALLAATILPQFHAGGARSADDLLHERLHVLRGQIELYRVQHDNTLPGANGPLLDQLTRRTDRDGHPGEGGDHVFGPYLVGDAFPENPLTGRSAVAVVGTPSPADAKGADPAAADRMTADPADTTHGWVYDPATGELHAQGDAEHFAW